ncbi:hypothetical protein B0J18DRAFT_196527 [Chaetomium sp. MPI-SDFR-AT-0129]|nr:hypothetical protein B0J18DRAFT_196527 [Chaetomium sp. MPI-SDFR-AT-0129]
MVYIKVSWRPRVLSFPPPKFAVLILCFCAALFSFGLVIGVSSPMFHSAFPSTQLPRNSTTWGPIRVWTPPKVLLSTDHSHFLPSLQLFSQRRALLPYAHVLPIFRQLPNEHPSPGPIRRLEFFHLNLFPFGSGKRQHHDITRHRDTRHSKTFPSVFPFSPALLLACLVTFLSVLAELGAGRTGTTTQDRYTKIKRGVLVWRGVGGVCVTSTNASSRFGGGGEVKSWLGVPSWRVAI